MAATRVTADDARLLFYTYHCHYHPQRQEKTPIRVLPHPVEGDKTAKRCYSHLSQIMEMNDVHQLVDKTPHPWREYPRSHPYQLPTQASVLKHNSARCKDHSAAIKKLYKERAKVILTLRKTPLQTQAKAMRLKEQKKVMVRCSSHPVARCNRRPQAFSGNGIFLLNTSKLKHYLVKNWAGIKEEWVMGFKSESGHFFNNSNNMVESLNQKLKEVIHQ